MIVTWWRRAVRRFIASSNPGSARRRGRHFCRPYLDRFEQRVLLSMLVVTNTNDSGPGSLRQAILDADRSPGKNTIEFHIGSGGLQTIAPTSVLPSIIYPVYLDGTTQPGFTGSPLIVLSGTNAGPGTSGLVIQGGSSTVMGLVINGFQANGLWLQDNGNDLIVGNYLGTDATGTVAIGNQAGLFVTAPNNTIGGTSAASRNLISGNRMAGIDLGAYPSVTNVVLGNEIGTDITGTKALGNRVGVLIEYGPNTVGGMAAGAANLISGNTDTGLAITGSYNSVQSNYIGTDITGKSALPNGIGVSVGGANNVLGGTAAGAGNVISGNTNYGVLLNSDGANTVEGNFVGTDRSSTVVLRNSVGVYLSGAVNNTVGGTTPGARNIISGNYEGIVFFSSTRNSVQGNYLGTDLTGRIMVGNFKAVDILSGSGNTIGGTAMGSGNLISGNPGGGVSVFADGNFVQGNRIGTDVTGSMALPNGYGVYLSGSNITVGGNTASAGNLISGNMDAGVEIFGASGTGNQVLGNRIGTDITGTAAIGNQTGVSVSAPDNTIGGTAAGAGNLVSGNRGDGIVLAGTETSVLGNFIGTDITGVLSLGNSIGLSVSGTENTIGGMAPGAGNVISGNRGGGLRLLADAHDDLVQGNYIGTDVTGTRAQANQDGVLVIGSNNTIGGTTPGAGNLISGNNAGGIGIVGQGNILQGNRIGTDASGEAKLQNGEGILISGANNTVGGTTPGARNLISGNENLGIGLEGSNNLIQGNYIGTDTFGKLALGNFGIYITGSNNTIGGTAAGAGNLISGNGGWGVDISGRANTVQGNLIGTDATGTAPLSNWVGIDVNGSSNLIGGSDRGAGNIISGNLTGVELEVGDNQVEGNLIGTDASGSVALGNLSGVVVAGPNDTIGGTIPGAGNVISGNQQDGIFIGEFGTKTQVQGNLIGTDITGTMSLGNGGNGVYVRESYNTIGGTTPGAGNIISSNGQNGIYIAPFCSMTQVQGNLIGTDVTGKIPLGNGRNGIYVNWSDNTIGGMTAGAANTIAFSHNDGVLVYETVGNAILTNSIHDSTHLGIELIHGGNDNQPFPVLTSAVSDGSTLTFQGSLSCAPTTTYRVQFFSNSVRNSSGFGEGERFIGSFTVTTDSTGSASFLATFVTAVPLGQYLSATATDANNNTSQFSRCVQVAAPQRPGGPPMSPHRMLMIRDMLFTGTWDGSSLQSALPVTAPSKRNLDLFFRVLAEGPGYYTSPPYHREVRSNYLPGRDDVEDVLCLPHLVAYGSVFRRSSWNSGAGCPVAAA